MHTRTHPEDCPRCSTISFLQTGHQEGQWHIYPLGIKGLRTRETDDVNPSLMAEAEVRCSGLAENEAGRKGATPLSPAFCFVQ